MNIKQNLPIEQTWQTVQRWLTKRTEQTALPSQECSVHGLAVRTGLKAGQADDTNSLYFTAGPNDEANGLFGYIEVGE